MFHFCSEIRKIAIYILSLLSINSAYFIIIQKLSSEFDFKRFKAAVLKYFSSLIHFKIVNTGVTLRIQMHLVFAMILI